MVSSAPIVTDDYGAGERGLEQGVDRQIEGAAGQVAVNALTEYMTSICNKPKYLVSNSKTSVPEREKADAAENHRLHLS
jgi:hypothetical protein